MLEQKDSAFLELIVERKKVAGSYGRKDNNRPKPHIAGTSDSIIKLRG